jgi:hypothetical protein
LAGLAAGFFTALTGALATAFFAAGLTAFAGALVVLAVLLVFVAMVVPRFSMK